MTRNMIFLHGLESSSQTYKASVIRNSFPELIVPDFTGPLEARMKALYPSWVTKKIGPSSALPLAADGSHFHL